MKIGFLSDAHGNYSAFLKAIDLLHDHKVQKIFFLGDAIGYFDSDQIPFYIEKHAIEALKGNHEQMVIEENVPPEKDYIYRLKQHYCHAFLPIISSWKETLSLNFNNRKIHMFHGSFNDPIWGYTYEDNPFDGFKEADVFVCGATHRPFIKNVENKMLVNIGSCGFPRDIGNQGSCGIYDSDHHTFSILRFDITDSIVLLKNSHEALDPAILTIWNRR